jgi:hypothetical protein
MKQLLRLSLLLVATFCFGQTPIYQFDFQTTSATVGTGTLTFQNDGTTGNLSYVADRSEVNANAVRMFKQTATSPLASLPLSGNSRTISCWVNHTTTDAVSLFSYGGTRTGTAFGLDVIPASNQIAFKSIGGAGFDVFINRATVLNSWTHYAVTFNGTEVRVYVNGSLVGGPYTIIIGTTNSEFRLGIDVATLARTGNIVFDDLNIFTSALTPAQITTLFRRNNNQTTLQSWVPSNGLVYANHFTAGNISDSSTTGAVIGMNTSTTALGNTRNFDTDQTMTYNIDNYGNVLRIGRPGAKNFSAFIKVKVDPIFAGLFPLNNYITFFRHGPIFMRYLLTAGSFTIQVGYERVGGGFTLISGNTSVDVTKTNSLCIVNDEANSLFRLYWNGTELATNPYGSGEVVYSNNSSDKLILGVTGVPIQGFKGQIDDVLLYNRVLTATEVASLSSSSLSTSSFKSNNLKFSLYPNPATNLLKIDIDSDIQSVEIYSLQGQKIMTASSKEINISNLSAGIYMVRVQDVDGSVATQKIIKE